jgi:hypothetical protein
MVNKQIVRVVGNRWNMSNAETHLLLRVAMYSVLKAADAGFNIRKRQIGSYYSEKKTEKKFPLSFFMPKLALTKKILHKNVLLKERPM